MPFVFCFFLIASTSLAQEENRAFPSPDGRFVLKVIVPEDESADAKLEVVEKASGKVVGDLGADYRSIASQIRVAWSADSKRVAYRTAGQREWHTVAYFWNGSLFESISLPEELPSPEIKFRKSDEAGGVKNYGGGEEPVRWLKSGELELLSQETQMARESGRTYTATLTITIGFDAQQHASVKKVSKSKTRID